MRLRVHHAVMPRKHAHHRAMTRYLGWRQVNQTNYLFYMREVRRPTDAFRRRYSRIHSTVTVVDEFG